jgi:hypothetical protein
MVTDEPFAAFTCSVTISSVLPVAPFDGLRIDNRFGPRELDTCLRKEGVASFAVSTGWSGGSGVDGPRRLGSAELTTELRSIAAVLFFFDAFEERSGADTCTFLKNSGATP